jgi:hypothetical protein
MGSGGPSSKGCFRSGTQQGCAILNRPGERGSATIEFTLFSTLTTLVFGLSSLVALGGLSKAHCQTVLVEQARKSFYVGSSVLDAASTNDLADALRGRVKRELDRWPLAISLSDLTILTAPTAAPVANPPAAAKPAYVSVSASFVPFGGLVPGLRFAEKVAVLVEDG